LAVLGLFSWLLRTSYTNFISEMAAAREERRELGRSFSETVANHFHEAAVALAQLNQAVSQHIVEQKTLFSQLQGAIEDLCEEMRRQSESLGSRV